MDREELERIYEEEILPGVVATYEQDGQRDGPARREAWNDWTDALCKDGQISEEQYNDDEGLPDRLDA